MREFILFQQIDVLFNQSKAVGFLKEHQSVGQQVEHLELDAFSSFVDIVHLILADLVDNDF